MSDEVSYDKVQEDIDSMREVFELLEYELSWDNKNPKRVNSLMMRVSGIAQNAQRGTCRLSVREEKAGR